MELAICPVENVLGEEGNGFKYTMHNFNKYKDLGVWVEFLAHRYWYPDTNINHAAGIYPGQLMLLLALWQLSQQRPPFAPTRLLQGPLLNGTGNRLTRFLCMFRTMSTLL